MALVVENLRLKELMLVVEQNRAFFDEFKGFLEAEGYDDIFSFVADQDNAQAQEVIRKYFRRTFTATLLDGIGRPFPASKAKWYFISWLLRDAPAQRLGPILTGMPGGSLEDRRVALIDQIRIHVGGIFQNPEQWEWAAVAEVLLARLEGSRRALKGGLFEALVRTTLQGLLKERALKFHVLATEVRLHDETYDVVVAHGDRRVLLPVKTRETMGGGHAGLFTRDIHKSISVAQQHGYSCIPIIIAESWTGDLDGLPCDHRVHIDANPNQLKIVEPRLRDELGSLMPVLQGLLS